MGTSPVPGRIVDPTPSLVKLAQQGLEFLVLMLLPVPDAGMAPSGIWRPPPPRTLPRHRSTRRASLWNPLPARRRSSWRAPASSVPARRQGDRGGRVVAPPSNLHPLK